jgi:hypothetical protein
MQAGTAIFPGKLSGGVSIAGKPVSRAERSGDGAGAEAGGTKSLPQAAQRGSAEALSNNGKVWNIVRESADAILRQPFHFSRS